jgi:alpha,alpha-trehalose phosphorylase
VGLSFRLRYRGRIIHVEVRSRTAKYSLLSGDPMPITHHGQQVSLGTDPVTLDIPSIEPLPSPSQPVGRVPQSRRSRQ